MGIESDQLVFDYLSRVGDLAHGTSMTAAERARLVSGLRTDIERMRTAAGGAESKAATRRILRRLGRPEDLVANADGGSGGSADGGGPDAGGGTGAGGAARTGGTDPEAERRPRTGNPADDTRMATHRPSVPEEPRSSRLPRAPKLSAPKLPRLPQQLRKDPEAAAEPPAAARGAAPPHLAGMDELGPEEYEEPDWWNIAPAPFRGGSGSGTSGSRAGSDGSEAGGTTSERPGSDLVPGFVGGVELPEVMKPPGEESTDGRGEAPKAPGAGDSDGDGPRAPSAKPGTDTPFTESSDSSTNKPVRFGPLLRLLGLGRDAGGPRAGGFVELAATVLLVAGAVVGSLPVLAAGWLGAYWSPRLSRTEGKWAALGMPGLVAGGMMLWLWGRATEKWGPEIAKGEGALGDALGDAWPVALRVAAVSSALFLLWRARRPGGGG
ncbi:hypothetical protein [Streptomyces oceani]|uniref:Uncharacterized protein n=1 Tax=Streptomyces oceani TaxID=1075402 RepID=A0A1E7KLR7_9ACTN|nr:hypothetical protein [Streptomyces oceani]OEV04895.1 hypothetical protein AN216_05270 [Streptomyces oceani]